MRMFLIALGFAFALAPFARAAPIHDAAKEGDVAAIAAALDAGEDVNKRSGQGTPLYIAAIRGHVEAAKLLIARGADVNARTRMGTPLMAAAARREPDMVRLLLASGAEVNGNIESQAALHVAAARGNLESVQAPVEAGADVNAQHKIGSGADSLVTTPLHLAIQNDHEDVADYLRSHGVAFPHPAPIATKLAAADAAKGQQVFERVCWGCHSP